MATVKSIENAVTLNEESDSVKFTYDEREVSLIDLLPQIYQPISDYRAMTNACGFEVYKLYSRLTSILDDQFISSASESVLAMLEKQLGITPNGTDTIDERRFRVLARINDTPPYTDRYLERRLNELCGEGLWRVHKDYTDYTLIIEVSLDSVANTETVINMVKDIIPANLSLVVRNYRSRHSELGAFTHAQLAAYTQSEIKYAEMFK